MELASLFETGLACVVPLIAVAGLIGLGAAVFAVIERRILATPCDGPESTVGD